MQDVIVDRREKWVEILINRPDKLNALRDQTALEIMQVLEEAEADRSCRAILIRGLEKAFCTGVDTSEFKQDPDEIYELWRRRKRSRKVNQMFKALPEVTKPVIAGEGSQFGLPESRLGLMPGGAGTQTLPRLIGKPLAKELMWTGRRLSAQEALALRIVNRVADKGQAIEVARELATKIAANSPLSAMFCKQAIERGMNATLQEGMNIEADSFFSLAFSTDKEEGLAAFREKRDPVFTGR
jgi:enoyl-CoA hydratase/carnithine racemase